MIKLSDQIACQEKIIDASHASLRPLLSFKINEILGLLVQETVLYSRSAVQISVDSFPLIKRQVTESLASISDQLDHQIGPISWLSHGSRRIFWGAPGQEPVGYDDMDVIEIGIRLVIGSKIQEAVRSMDLTVRQVFPINQDLRFGYYPEYTVFSGSPFYIGMLYWGFGHIWQRNKTWRLIQKRNKAFQRIAQLRAEISEIERLQLSSRRRKAWDKA